MPKLFCPSCMKPVAVPDDFAGREITCPSCNKVFEAPAKYTPTVIAEPPPAPPSPKPLPPPPPEPKPMSSDAIANRPTPPPGLVPPMPASGPAPATALPAGYTRARSYTIHPVVIAWLPAVLLVVTLICTFASGWGCMSAGIRPIRRGRGARCRLAQPQPAPRCDDADAGRLEHPLPFRLATDGPLPDRPDPRHRAGTGGSRLPFARSAPHSALAGIWKWRKLAILLFAATAFALAFSQVLYGFGLERAIRETVAEKYARSGPRRRAMLSNWRRCSTGRIRSSPSTTSNGRPGCMWRWCAISWPCSRCLPTPPERRGDKPPPRLVLQY